MSKNDKPTLRFVLKSKNKKWNSVLVHWEHKGTYESAKFRHPGDAHRYAKTLQDEAHTFAERLLHIDVEC